MRHVAFVAITVAVRSVGVTAAFAHARLKRSEPVAGSTIHRSPSVVELWFTEALEPAYCTMKVMADRGEQVDKGDVSVDVDDHKILKVSLPSLPPGSYTVLWHAVSVDTHSTEGKFTFKVAP